MFSFLHVFIYSGVFKRFHCWSHLFTSLFLYSLSVFRFCAILSLRIWESAFYSEAFFVLHSFLLLSNLLWGCRFFLEGFRSSHWGSKHRIGPSVCLNHTVFGNYVISRELCLNLSKYVDILPLRKSVINSKHFS